MLKIKTIREAKGLNQNKVASAAGITPAYLCELESGAKDNPGFNVLGNIARALGVSVAELLDDNSDPKSA